MSTAEHSFALMLNVLTNLIQVAGPHYARINVTTPTIYKLWVEFSSKVPRLISVSIDRAVPVLVPAVVEQLIRLPPQEAQLAVLLFSSGRNEDVAVCNNL